MRPRRHRLSHAVNLWKNAPGALVFVNQVQAWRGTAAPKPNMKRETTVTSVEARLACSMPILAVTALAAIVVFISACGNPKQPARTPESARMELAKLTKDFSPTAFADSVRNGDTMAVRLFIDAGMNVEEAGTSGVTPLMIASANGNTDMVKLLLEKSAKLNAATQDGQTALQFAHENEHDDVATILEAKGGKDFNQINEILVEGVIRGKTDLVQTALSQGADPNVRLDRIKYHGLFSVSGSDKFGTPLIMAAKDGSEDIARILLQHGANPNRTDGDAYSSLMCATKAGHAGMVKLLLTNGANVNFQEWDRSALSVARKGQLTEIERILIDAGAKK
jgi:ankyrin repeat protein